MKKLYQIATNVSLDSGGQRTAVVNIHNHINKNNNFSSSILTNEKEETDPFIHFPSEKFKFWNYASELTKYLNSNIKNDDVMHLHGVFMHTQYASSRFAVKNNIPHLITPHGMLEPWYLKDKRLKKQVYLTLLLKKILQQSTIIHAITPFEKENLFKLSGHKNIVEIPNFINHTELPNNLIYKPDEEFLLFLSRIHPGKGLDILLQAMRKIENKKIKLKIVGAENNYSDFLKKMALELGIEDRIEFLGAVYGDEKYALFANAKGFIAPSYSEAIGMVNLEAAICKTPVVTTYNTGINPQWNQSGGIMINPNVNELINAINDVVGWSEEERNQRGQALSNFVIDHYSWNKKGEMWEELYSSL
jgi:glycosyltransferase involved in cell wall biosynthesis